MFEFFAMLTLVSEIGDTTVTFTIPAETPSGDYLIRVEQIGLHVAETEGGAQFYLSCGQITITNGGNGTPSPLVAFPGAYSPTDPGILIDIYYPVVSLLISFKLIWSKELTECSRRTIPLQGLLCGPQLRPESQPAALLPLHQAAAP